MRYTLTLLAILLSTLTVTAQKKVTINVPAIDTVRVWQAIADKITKQQGDLYYKPSTYVPNYNEIQGIPTFVVGVEYPLRTSVQEGADVAIGLSSTWKDSIYNSPVFSNKITIEHTGGNAFKLGADGYMPKLSINNNKHFYITGYSGTNYNGTETNYVRYGPGNTQILWGTILFGDKISVQNDIIRFDLNDATKNTASFIFNNYKEGRGLLVRGKLWDRLMYVNAAENKILFGDTITLDPRAFIQIMRGNETRAPIAIAHGKLLSSPLSGAIENNGRSLTYTDSSNIRHFLVKSDTTITGAGTLWYNAINTSIVNFHNPETGKMTIPRPSDSYSGQMADGHIIRMRLTGAEASNIEFSPVYVSSEQDTLPTSILPNKVIVLEFWFDKPRTLFHLTYKSIYNLPQ